MNPKYYGLIEMIFSFGVVFILLIQQLWSVRTKKPFPPKLPEKLS